MIRLVAIDLDGTLLKDDKTICPENIEAIGKALKQGCKIVLASGRSFESMKREIDALGLGVAGQYAIGLNGGILFETSDGKLLARNGMRPEEAEEIIDLSRTWEAEVNAQLYDGDGVCVERWDTTTDFYQKVTRATPVVVSDLKTLASEAVKIGFFLKQGNPDPAGPLDEAKALKQRAEAVKPEHVNCLISAPYLVEFCDERNNKGSGLIKLGEILGIDISEMIAIGDLDNDLPMIRTAGLGVAMKNAPAEVKAEADYVTERTNNEGGVAEVIEKFVLQ